MFSLWRPPCWISMFPLVKAKELKARGNLTVSPAGDAILSSVYP